eukprot:5773242-Pyramimonas_sp.AAC.1
MSPLAVLGVSGAGGGKVETNRVSMVSSPSASLYREERPAAGPRLTPQGLLNPPPIVRKYTVAPRAH